MDSRATRRPPDVSRALPVLLLLAAATLAAGPAEDAASAGPSTLQGAASAISAAADSLSLPAATPADWETLYTVPEEYRLEPFYGFRYNRVDGPAPTLGLAVRNEEDLLPLLRAQATYAFSRERLLAEFAADVPLGHERLVTVGGSVYRRTATEDAWIVSEIENTVFALLSRKDYHDHYEAEGFEGHLSLEPGRDAAFSAGARLEDHASLGVETRVAAWGVDDLFRANPAVEEGEEGLVWGGIRVGPAVIPPKGGSRIVLRYERAGAPIDRDFEYGRVRVQGNLRRRVGLDHGIRVRALLGSTRSGQLPLQKVWKLGGIGTLRGEPFQSSRGDQFYLLNAEYSYLFRKNLHAVLLLDWGTAWFGRGAWSESRPVFDGGIGVRVADGPVTVTVARNLQRSDAPYLVGVRLGGSWE